MFCAEQATKTMSRQDVTPKEKKINKQKNTCQRGDLNLGQPIFTDLAMVGYVGGGGVKSMPITNGVKSHSTSPDITQTHLSHPSLPNIC